MPFQSTKDFDECEQCGDIICFGECEDTKILIGDLIDKIIEYGKEYSTAKMSYNFDRAYNIENNLIPQLKRQILNLI